MKSFNREICQWKKEFAASTLITSNLSEIIRRQEKDLNNYDKESIAADIKKVKTTKNEFHQASLKEVMHSVDHKLKRTLPGERGRIMADYKANQITWFLPQ